MTNEIDFHGGSGSSGSLYARVVALVDRTHTVVATRTNAALTLMNWQIGSLIHVEILGQERAEHGHEIVATLSQQLTRRFGRGFDRTNLTRMVRFAQHYPTPRQPHRWRNS